MYQISAAKIVGTLALGTFLLSGCGKKDLPPPRQADGEVRLPGIPRTNTFDIAQFPDQLPGMARVEKFPVSGASATIIYFREIHSPKNQITKDSPRAKKAGVQCQEQIIEAIVELPDSLTEWPYFAEAITSPEMRDQFTSLRKPAGALVSEVAQLDELLQANGRVPAGTERDKLEKLLQEKKAKLNQLYDMTVSDFGGTLWCYLGGVFTSLEQLMTDRESLLALADKTEKSRTSQDREKLDDAVFDAEPMMSNNAVTNLGNYFTTNSDTRAAYANIGAGHYLNYAISNWNTTHPERKMQLIVLTPEAIKRVPYMKDWPEGKAIEDFLSE